jgi:hypothetical protein
MVIDRATIRARLEKCVDGLEEQINSIMMESMANGVDPYSHKSETTGVPVLTPLIISQTSALMMLAGMPEE